jgi:predicted MPP superfamily phosphohydrolase
LNYAVIGGAFCAVFFILVAAFYNGLTVRYYIAESGKVTSSLRILQITDLHNSLYGAGQKELLAKINELNPDIICMTGDIFDERIEEYNAAALVRAIRNYKVYFVMGNHEAYIKDFSPIMKLLDENNITVLDGNAVRIYDSHISVCGVSDPIKEERNEGFGGASFTGQLSSARHGCRESDFKILLSHRPEKIGEYMPYCFDLILSGHAHGGQWRIPFLINGLWAPHQGLFPEYAGGIYHRGRTMLVVCRGLSKYLIIPRIFNPVELCCIDIKPLK